MMPEVADLTQICLGAPKLISSFTLIVNRSTGAEGGHGLFTIN